MTIQRLMIVASNGEHVPADIYNIAVEIVTAAKPVIVERNCFAFQFTNIGDVKAWVNGMVINPSSTPGTSLGDSRSISAHKLDIYKGNILVQFDNASAGTNPNVEIVQLFYAEEYVR